MKVTDSLIKINRFLYLLKRLQLYIKRKRLLKYIYLKLFKGYKVLNETSTERRIKINSNLIFEYPLNDNSYEISANPKNELLVDSYIDINKGTFIDIGAFIGKYTIKLGKNPNIKVLSIEPNPKSFELLVKNLKLNGLSNNVVALNCAISDPNNTILEFIDDYAMTRVSESSDNRIIKVKSTTLNSLIDDYSLTPPLLIKIDTEGFELKVLKSFDQYLSKDIDVKLIVEILPKSEEIEIIINLMKKYNFSCEQIDYSNYYFQKIR